MSWVADNKLSWPSYLALKVISCGRVPHHLAFIMDGNRRFAKKNNVEKVQGHTKGFDKLSETLQWCLEIGVKEVTVYAFSIENYKRTKEEVEDLMDLARDKFKRLLNERNKLEEYGVRIRVIGNRDLLPKDIVKLASQAESITENHKKMLLNVAFSYASQDEITSAVNTTLKGLEDLDIEESDLNLNLFNQCLYTRTSSPPDMIIRTSGETRLSDFLLWQGSYSYLHFTGVLWPELSVWDFFWAIFKYQRICNTLDEERRKYQLEPLTSQAVTFLNKVNNIHVEMIAEAVLT